MQNFLTLIKRSDIFSIALLILLISCNDLSKEKGSKKIIEHSNTVEVKLVDSLGIVSLSMPLRYDTSYLWIDQSDCGKPCEEQKYRFQPKIYHIRKESGWLHSAEPAGPIDRFTISHSGYFAFHDGDTSMVFTGHSHFKAQLTSIPQDPPITFDTIEKINDRYYSIFAMQKSDSIQYRKVVGITTIKGNFTWFQYELLTGKEDSISKSFIKNSIDLIHTIRLSKGI